MTASSHLNLSRITAQAAARHGERIALQQGERRWSYRDIDARVDRLASALAGRHEPGSRIGVMMRNRHEAVLLQFALERASLVRVPLNARYTAHDLSTLMADCGACALFFDESCAPAVRDAGLGEGVALVQVDAGDGGWAGMLAHPVTPGRLHGADPETLATINYTSGTTGRPKGVMLTHGNWMAVYRNFLVDRDFRADDVVAYVGPLTHSAGAYLAPWYWRGARNVIVDPPTPEGLLDVIEAERVTAFTCVPTFLTRLLKVPGLRGRRLDSVRLVGYGAEPLPAATLALAWDVFGPVLWQNYGQTEAMMTCVHLSPGEHLEPSPAAGTAALRSGLLGRPYSFVEAVVRDPEGRSVAAGEIGELTLRGDHVMAGYWGQPEATAQALRDGWLWTGDLAIQDAEGMLSLVGRRKDMLICGGFNIYPGEVEQVLMRADGVSEAVVLGRPDPEWGEIAVAFVTPLPGRGLSVEALAAQVKPWLGIKLPKRWYLLGEMPRNGNGKIDKRALAQFADSLNTKEKS